jgi:adenine-specific DNA glycosylase
MRPQARLTHPGIDEICKHYICEECPINEDCDMYQQYRFDQEKLKRRQILLQELQELMKDW